MHEQSLPMGYQDNEANVIAHMSPQEIEELIRIQGRSDIDPETGFHSFVPLGEYISHRRVSPHIESFMQNYRGMPHANAGLSRYIEDAGQHGDTKAVVLPRVLANLFDSALNNGQPSINPKTGKRQYFLGALLGGLGSVLAPFTSAIGGMLPGIGSALSSGIGGALSSLGGAASSLLPGIGSALSGGLGKVASSVLPQIGNMASSMLPQLGNMASQGLQHLAPQLGNLAAQGISSMAQRYGGNTGGQIAGALSPAINSAVSGLASGLGQQLGGGQGNYGQTMQNAGGQAFNALKPMAQQFASNAMSSLANRIAPSAGMNPAMAGEGAGSGISSMLDALPEMAMAM